MRQSDCLSDDRIQKRTILFICQPLVGKMAAF